MFAAAVSRQEFALNRTRERLSMEHSLGDKPKKRKSSRVMRELFCYGSDGLSHHVSWQGCPIIWAHPGGNYRTVLCELFPTFTPQLALTTTT